MIKLLLEQWKAGQEQRRAIGAERWEQEKRWSEEDRVTRLEKEAEQARLKAEQEKSGQEARAEEERNQKEKGKRNSDLYGQLHGVHHDLLNTAGTVSFVQLECHEDTWSYIARQAFGMWQPRWTTSVLGEAGGPPADGKFIKDPNLSEGRIVKHSNGMQVIIVSGDNLTRILEVLFDRTYNFILAGSLNDKDHLHRATSRPLYRRLKKIVQEVDQTDRHTTGRKFCIDVRVEAPAEAGE
ncbi:hypothetical protein [Streptomyces anulatus]|uniref:hypothetical protein n=1 Tax=Streptomyces anulatus TaxID=1892 RepID=UPI00366832C6